MKKFGIMIAVLAVAGLATSAYAFKITNVTNNEVVFMCSYENGTPGANVQTDTPEIGTFDFLGWYGAAPGTLGDASAHNWVEDGTVMAPAEGKNSHRVEPAGNPRPYAHAIPVGTPAEEGDLMRIEAAIMSISEWPGIRLSEELDSDYTAQGPPYPKTIGSLWFTGPDWSADWGAGWTDVGSAFTQANGYQVWLNAHTPNRWNSVVMEYVNGSTNLDVTINGVNNVYTNMKPGIMNHVSFGSPYNNSHGYLDAVPEPATLSLLGLGGLCALLRRRRK